MDITSLLSPSADNGDSHSPSRESTASASSSPRKPRVRPSTNKRSASGLSQELRRSPDDVRGPTSNPLPAGSSPHSAMHTPASRSTDSVTEHSSGGMRSPYRPLLNSYPSESNYTTLSEGSVDHLRSGPKLSHTPLPMLRPSEHADSQRSPALALSAMAPPIMRTQSGQSMADLTMAEAPSQTPPPRNFTSATLTSDESSLVTELLSYLADHSYAYSSHVQLINLLHKGFQNHLNRHVNQDPHRYELLAELRQARDAMDSRFAVGEDIWVDWLLDETSLAKSWEEHLAVTELFEKAIKDEPISIRIWQNYLDWVMSNHALGYSSSDQLPTGWTREDQEFCRELFTQDMLFNILEKAADATRWRLDQSHTIWNRWAGAQREMLQRSPNEHGYQRLREAYIHRLSTPHLQVEGTQAAFWSLVQKFEANNWEVVMAGANEVTEPMKKQVGFREKHEADLQSALDSGDDNVAYYAFESYLTWEKTRKQKQRGECDTELRYALYERALLRFPTSTELWLEYVDFFISRNSTATALPLLERATRHCPWSGDLWATRILRSDVERRPHEDIEATKHRATNSGLLDVGGIGELLKMLQQWCSYLRRHAFKNSSTEDDIDTAEIGILSALENVQEACGNEASVLSYPLQNIQIKFLTEARRFPEAREIHRQLTPIHANSAEFWARYYNWELWLWGYERLSEARRVETQENGPHLATAVVQEALAQRHLDLPERVLDMYLSHFQLHESGEKLEMAMVRAREFSKAIAKKRAKEAAVAASQTAPQVSVQHTGLMEEVETNMGGVEASSSRPKRKASVTAEGDQINKRVRNETIPNFNEGIAVAASPGGSPQMKRDREHNTITVRNLAPDVEETDIQRFFREIDKPLSINILKDAAGTSASATVEFATHEDVLAAKTRQGKPLRGREVQISSGSQATIYVTNYPPDYDETAIRGLFEAYGEIASVRLPSLRYNSRRRFCYVTFLSADVAKFVEDAMDGKLIGQSHRLVAKISNPNAKKQRSGAQAEGREIYLQNLDFKTSDEEVKQLFSEYGTVVSMHLLKNVQNKLTGSGFVVFSRAEEAQAALAANNKPFKDRILHVEIAHEKGGAPPLDKARKMDVIVKHDGNDADASTRSSRKGFDASMKSPGALDVSVDGSKTVRERSAAILNLPDTVNDARIRTLMEKHGSILKIQLRREKEGAIVEFTNLNDAFNVRQGVDCSALGPNVRSGEVQELFQKPDANGAKAETSASTLSLRPVAVSRPAQKRGGRRGGLGVKRGGLGASVTDRAGTAQENQDGSATQGSGSKSNADFRAMLEQSRGGQQSG